MNNKTLFSSISNTLFLLLTILIISFIWVNYYIHNFYLSLFSSFLIVCGFSIIYFSLKSFKNKKVNQKNKLKLKHEELKTTLIFNTNSVNSIIISKLFNYNKLTPTEKQNQFTYNDQDIFILLYKEKITEEDIIGTLKTRINNSVKIFCIEYTCNIAINKIDIEIIDLSQIENQLNINPIKIEPITLKKTPKLSLFQYLCIIFNKTKSRGYFGFGLLLILTSLFSPYYTYYLIIGTLLLLVSIYSRFNKKFN